MSSIATLAEEPTGLESGDESEEALRSPSLRARRNSYQCSLYWAASHFTVLYLPPFR